MLLPQVVSMCAGTNLLWVETIKHEEFYINNEEICSKNEKLRIENEEFNLKNIKTIKPFKKTINDYNLVLEIMNFAVGCWGSPSQKVSETVINFVL